MSKRKYPPESARSRKALCPFYRRDTPHGITCEGLVEKSTIQLNYQRAADCTVQFDTFCADHYKFCEIYRAICAAAYADECKA